MRPTEPKLINEIIQQYMRADGIAGKASRQQASYLWTEIVGPGINRYTTRRYVTDELSRAQAGTDIPAFASG